jgi:L-iditol 2-dehydrogenase
VNPGNIGRSAGHEYAAEVVEVGSKVTHFKVGDRFYSHGGGYPCFRCAQCQQGEYWRCTGDKNAPRIGMEGNAAFQEYRLLPFIDYETEVTVKCPTTMDFHDIALIEPLYLSIGLVNKVTPGDTVVVIGQHIIGLGVTARLKDLGIAKKIITSSISKKHRDASEEVGADVVVDDIKQDIVRVVAEETNGEGAESVFICDHRPAAYVQGFMCAKDMGKVWMANRGLQSMEQQQPTIRIGNVANTNNKSLVNTGVAYFQTAWQTLGPYLPRMEAARDLILAGRVNAAKHVTHKFPLEKINEAFKLAYNFHECIEVQIEL